MYKLLALDMDGTILTSQKTVSPATVKAINNLSPCAPDEESPN